MRPKDQGTAWETRIVNICQDAGLPARRIAEGGQYDLGDVLLCDEIVIEAKDRAALNIHVAVENAGEKAYRECADAGDYCYRSAVWWKRRTRKAGNTNRTQDAPPIVAMSQDTFLWLVKEAMR